MRPSTPPTSGRRRPARPCRAAAAAALAAAVTAGCSAEPPPFHVEVRVSPTPATVGGARVLVEVRENDGSPADAARVDVRPGAPGGVPGEPVEAVAGGSGVWVADPVPLPRPGSWTLEVTVTGARGERVRREAPLEVVGPPPPS